MGSNRSVKTSKDSPSSDTVTFWSHCLMIADHSSSVDKLICSKCVSFSGSANVYKCSDQLLFIS